MSGGHVHALYRHGTSPIHRADSAVKVVSVFLFVVAVVATPREAVWGFGLHAMLLGSVLVAARLGPGFVLRRMIVLVPFFLAAATLPVLGSPPTNSWGLSVEGVWGAWNILVKGSLGLVASIVLAATTEGPDVVGGLERLRVPRVVTGIMGFMLRYIDVITGEFSRTRIAMRSRGHRSRGLGSIAALGRSIGHLFVRSYERGERVFLAMVSRGYRGTLPQSGVSVLAGTQIAVAAVGLTIAWAVVVVSVVLG